MTRIIVVGAGVSGLAAAARLAARGHEVTVCESTERAGGALGAWRWHHDDGDGDSDRDGGDSGGESAAPGSGLAFDTGAHTLTLPAVYRDLFIKTAKRGRGAAIRLEDVVDLVPLDPVRSYLFPDGTRLDLPNASRARLLTAFDDALGMGAGANWLRVLEHGSRVWNTIRPALVEAPGAGRRALARLLRTRAGRAALTPGRSLDGLTRRWFAHHPGLGLILDDYARQAGADPRHAPAVLTAQPYIEHAFGAWRIPAGMHTLGAALFERAVARGVAFRFDEPVARISTSSSSAPSGRATGVVLGDGTELAADVVIAAVDTAVLARLTGSAEQRLAYSQSVTTLCLALDDAPAPEMPHETVLLDETGPAIRIHVARERPSAWTVHADGDQAPDALLDAIARRGFDVRTRIRARHFVTTADREAATGAPGGAAYGPAPRDLRSALLRSPVAQPTRGLFHVGASARPGAGLSFAALSGWQASELIDPSG